MSPLRALATYGAMLLAFLALDLVWLGVLARGFYARHWASSCGLRCAGAPRWRST
ncbi:MAG: hypothetical protein R3E10_08415 [Gemmatimonadota bacterium]